MTIVVSDKEVKLLVEILVPDKGDPTAIGKEAYVLDVALRTTAQGGDAVACRRAIGVGPVKIEVVRNLAVGNKDDPAIGSSVET